MKKVLKWVALSIGTLWLVWAMLGEAPGELKPSATAGLFQRMLNVTPTPAETPTTAPAKSTQNAALCQNALQRRRAFLDAQGPSLAASWETMSIEDADRWVLAASQAADKDPIARQVMFDMATVRDLAIAVERYCGASFRSAPLRTLPPPPPGFRPLSPR